MFVRQAAAQFTAWTGRDAPVETMRDVVLTRLASR
jgi:shikimate 5-dehydrogenase